MSEIAGVISLMVTVLLGLVTVFAVLVGGYFWVRHAGRRRGF
jgi:hypothetical protein